MNDSQNHVTELLSKLQEQGLITLRSNGLEYQSGEDVIFVGWAEAASAAQIAQIRVSNVSKLTSNSGSYSTEQGRSEEKW